MPSNQADKSTSSGLFSKKLDQDKEDDAEFVHTIHSPILWSVEVLIKIYLKIINNLIFPTDLVTKVSKWKIKKVNRST